MDNANENLNKRVYYFDGLRGWASIAVLLHHIGAAMYGWPNFKDHFLQNQFGKILYIIFDGPFAVYIFFVLSGFVLSLNYLKNKNMRSLTGLVIRRIPRLGIPVFFSTIIIFFLIKAGYMRNHEAAALFDELNAWFNQYYDFHPTMKDMIKSIPGVFLTGNSKYNGVLWTMRYEFFGSYYIVLFIVALHYSDNYRKTLVWIISTAGLLYMLPQIACFNFGMLIAFVYIEKRYFIERIQRNKLVKILTIIFTGLSYGLNLLMGQLGIAGIQAILSTATAFLFVFSITFINIFQCVFSSKVSRFLGKISFPLYIIHLPIICSFTALLMIKYNQFKENIVIAVIIYFITALLSLIMACCFYPFEKISIWFSQKTWVFMHNEQYGVYKYNSSKKNGI
jgi:peptidoglycan/LPS O-acetylase OafA/YrhL